MPLLSRQKPLSLTLLLILTAGLPAAAQSPSHPPPSPSVAAKLRNLLPFPDAVLGPKIELNFGLGFSPEQGYYFFRQSSDYSGRIVAVRRQMTGGVADAVRYRMLGRLYHEAGLTTKSKGAFQQSRALYDAVLARRPKDGLALAGYGQTLQAAAAEAYLRKAVQAAPRSADVWLALGRVLEDEASPETEPKMHWGRKTEEVYDRAVSLAPRNPVVWATRGQFRTWGLPQLRGKTSSRAGLSDYAQAAALLPRNPDAQALVVTTDCFTFEIAHHIFTSLKAAKMEPAASDHRAEKCLRRITAIAQATHGAQASEAYMARAWVQFEFFCDFSGAQKSLNSALRHNPRQQDAIDYQMHVAGVTGDYVLLAAACRRELKHSSQTYLRLNLADVDYHLAQQKPIYWQEARTQMELAHAAAPHDDALRLGLAVLLLKSGQTADQSRADVLRGEIAPSSPLRTKSQQAEYDLTRGIAAALAGHQKEARGLLTSALQDDPQSQPAKSALALI